MCKERSAMAECMDFVESEKESEMSETVREPRVKRKNTEKLTFVCP